MWAFEYRTWSSTLAGFCKRKTELFILSRVSLVTNLHLLLLVFHHPLSFIPDLNPAFSAIFLTAAFLFLLRD